MLEFNILKRYYAQYAREMLAVSASLLTFLMFQAFGYLELNGYILTLSYSLLFSGAFLSIAVFHDVRKDEYVDLSLILLMAVLLFIFAALLFINVEEFKPTFFMVSSSLMLLRDIARYKATEIQLWIFSIVNVVSIISFYFIFLYVNSLNISALILCVIGLILIQIFPVYRVKFLNLPFKIWKFLISLGIELPSFLGGFVAFILPVYFLTTEDYTTFRVFASYLAFSTPLLNVLLVMNYSRVGKNSVVPNTGWLLLTLPFITANNYENSYLILVSIMIMMLCSVYFFSIIRVGYKKGIQFVSLLIPPTVMGVSYCVLGGSLGLNGSLYIFGWGNFFGILFMASCFYRPTLRSESA